MNESEERTEKKNLFSLCSNFGIIFVLRLFFSSIFGRSDVIDAAVSCVFDICYYLVVRVFARIILENISAQLSSSSWHRLWLALLTALIYFKFATAIVDLFFQLHISPFMLRRGIRSMPAVHSCSGRQSLLIVLA